MGITAPVCVQELAGHAAGLGLNGVTSVPVHLNVYLSYYLLG